MHITDRVLYPDQPKFISFTDFLLTPARVAFQGRTYDCSNKKICVAAPVHHIALRIIAGLAAILLLPLTLAALAIKWTCLNELNRVIEKAKRLEGDDKDLGGRLPEPPQDSSDDENEPIAGLESLGMVLGSDHLIVRASEMREPTIDFDKHEIVYLEHFNSRDPAECAIFKERLRGTLENIRAMTGKEAWAQCYIGMGLSEIYVFDQEGNFRVVDSESISYSQEPLHRYLNTKYHQVDKFILLTPERRAQLAHILD